MPHKFPTEETLEKLFKVLQRVARGEVWPKKGLLKYGKEIISEEYIDMDEACKNIEPKFHLSESIEQKFRRLVDAWHYERGPSSFASRDLACPSYQEIIAIGTPVLPFIFKEMEKHHGHWFLALQKITGADPVLPEHRGKINEMIQDWINWKINIFDKKEE